MALASDRSRPRLTVTVRNSPEEPGVYLFMDARGKVIYIGKAKNLRDRLSSYFQTSANLDSRKQAMVHLIRDISVIVTKSELEALALEANLIKQYKPRFNIILRDDKNYPYIRVDINEQWPRLEVVRRIKKDGARYFGPYVPAGAMWETLAFIRRHLGIRPCRYQLQRHMRPCIEHEMGRCPAPCAGLVNREDYMRAVHEAVMFLKGRKTELIRELEGRMKAHSDEMRYEEAAKARDAINSIRLAMERQRVVSSGIGDIDVIAHFMGGGDAVFQVIFIRDGLMTGARDFIVSEASGIPLNELYEDFLVSFYSKDLAPPPEIIMPQVPSYAQQLADWLSARRTEMTGAKGSVLLKSPASGRRFELIKMAQSNARSAYESKRYELSKDASAELKERFGLSALPVSIGAFDISNIQGRDAVGAFVWWEDGAFRKENYIHLKIKTVEGVDDYAMMRECVGRVLEKIQPPDLIIIDGGAGHLQAALDAVPAGVKSDIVAVAKQPDRAFTTDGSETGIEDSRQSSLLLRRIRDEAHRFAIGYHRKLRKKQAMHSPLLDVPGIGRARRLALLRRFKGLDEIRRAALEDIAQVPGMNRKAAEAVKEALK